MDRLPSLFVSHGAPTLALADSPTGRFFDALADGLPRPRAIIVASAHDDAGGAAIVGSAAMPRTIHDFGGVPAPLYALRYPAPGDPALARAITGTLRDAGIDARGDDARGLDHGAWVPLRRLFPRADIPVVPIAIAARGDAAYHARLGRALTRWRDDGVLVIGSGSITHNLRALDFARADAPASPASAAFIDWFAQRLAARDGDALLDWAKQAPHARDNHPSVEHLMPLFVAWGAGFTDDGTPPRATRLHHDVEFGALGMDAHRFD